MPVLIHLSLNSFKFKGPDMACDLRKEKASSCVSGDACFYSAWPSLAKSWLGRSGHIWTLLSSDRAPGEIVPWTTCVLQVFLMRPERDVDALARNGARTSILCTEHLLVVVLVSRPSVELSIHFTHWVCGRVAVLSFWNVHFFRA